MKIFFIAGIPRSGTSFVAGLLHKHGVWVGETIPADKHNKTGYFENIQIVDIVKTLMKENGMRARSDEFVSNSLHTEPTLREMVLNIVGDQDVWLYKDSKLLFLYPLFALAFPEATWIIPIRKSERIQESLYRHSTWRNRVKSIQDPNNYFLGMINRLKVRQDEIIFNPDIKDHIVYTDFIIDSIDNAKVFIEDCGLIFNPEVYQEFVRPELWHG